MRLTNPSAWSSLTACAIDCERMRAPVASSPMVCGPSRFRRPRTIAWVSGNDVSARMRRMIWPSETRSSEASSLMSSSFMMDRETVQAACIFVCVPEDRYKWVALSNATLAVLLATLDASITLIAMPDIFRGIHLDPLKPENSAYLLWMILGYLVVTSVLIVSLGRLGDMYGRVKIYNLGFVIYTVASLFLAIDWFTGGAGAMYLIVFRVVQGIGGACLLANAAAIITDAFPANQRGMALGINNVVGVSGMFVMIVLGACLAPIDWRLVFLISVPVGLAGTVWAYLKLEERGSPKRRPIDWWGNVTFAVGLVCVMVAVTYGIRPYGTHTTGWTSPRVLALFAAGGPSPAPPAP